MTRESVLQRITREAMHMTCDDQHILAERIAANVGYNLVPDEYAREAAQPMYHVAVPMTDEAMVERVAKALKSNLAKQFNAKPLGGADDWTATGGIIDLEEMARAAIEAMRAGCL